MQLFTLSRVLYIEQTETSGEEQERRYPRLSKAVFRMTIPIGMTNLRRCAKENGLD